MSMRGVCGRLLFALGRLLFGGTLAMMGWDNLRDIGGMVQYAESKDVPMADVLVPLASGALTAGGVGLVLWRLPALAATAVATFFAGVTPTMHDFWNLEGQERESQQIHFMKNLALFGGAVALLARALKK